MKRFISVHLVIFFVELLLKALINLITLLVSMIYRKLLFRK